MDFQHSTSYFGTFGIQSQIHIIIIIFKCKYMAVYVLNPLISWIIWWYRVFSQDIIIIFYFCYLLSIQKKKFNINYLYIHNFWNYFDDSAIYRNMLVSRPIWVATSGSFWQLLNIEFDIGACMLGRGKEVQSAPFQYNHFWDTRGTVNCIKTQTNIRISVHKLGGPRRIYK